ncbi:hypothetical protein QUF80_05530 [Desulfococcaceae bacterium HSG8]|nr:hypothetical protein [Desulfococcaceae bacterium HSG8]
MPIPREQPGCRSVRIGKSEPVRGGGFANPSRATRVLLGSDWQIRTSVEQFCKLFHGRGICQSPANNQVLLGSD